ncbi:MAG: coenzyme F420-0:L-glutamate ligase [Nostocoides sp.]
MPGNVEIIAVRDLPEVATGEDLPTLIVTALARMDLPLRAGDILAISSKVISKAAGLWRADRESAIAESTVRVVAERATDGGTTRIVQAVAGPVMAAGGVDASNTGGRDEVLVLPPDPDADADALRAGLAERSGVSPTALGVIITDTAGRPWRAGQVDFALGSSGVMVLDDLRGGVDADGRALSVTARAVVDELAAAADLVKGKVAAIPAAVIRGCADLLGPPVQGPAPAKAPMPPAAGARAGDLVRTGPGDWFAVGHYEAVRAALGVPPGSQQARACGIRPTTPEADPAAALTRAVAVALTGEGPDVGIDVGDDHVQITGGNEYAVGRLVARLEAALWTEELTVTSTTQGDLGVTLGVRPRG